MPHFNIPVPVNFDLPRAVCSYGYFLLAPNRWDPATQSLGTVLHDEKHDPSPVVISQGGRGGPLRVRVGSAANAARREALRRQITRMLHLDEAPAAIAHWHKLCPAAKRYGFARLFRSATLFEDVVKTFTGCNVTWRNTMNMNRQLVALVGGGAFPTPSQLARRREAWLKQHCRVGYRADRILRFARGVSDGSIDLARLEDPDITTEELFERLREIHGVGPYAAGNLCQLIGRYDRLAIDTETYRHFEQVHGIPRGRNPAKIHDRIEAHYARFAPFQFKAYWFELWLDYEKRMGDSRRWSAGEQGPNFTAAALQRG